MLGNPKSLCRLALDQSVERRLSGPLEIQQEFKWRQCWGVLKANLLFLFNREEDTDCPFSVIVVEDCFIELGDENVLGKEFTFEIKFKTTGRTYVLAADSFRSLGKWVSLLTITPIQYMNITTQSFQAQIEEKEKEISKSQSSEGGCACLLNGKYKMPAYHSKLESGQQVGNMGLLPLRTSFKGPAPRTSGEDIIDEALSYFKPNIFFREFEIKGASDRTLIYLTFYITECLRKLQRSSNKLNGQKDLNTLALSSQLPIPGESGFPLNSMYKSPRDRNEEEVMRAYLQQLRQELGARLCELAFPDPQDKASKWWLCFSRKRFMDKGLVSPGVSL